MGDSYRDWNAEDRFGTQELRPDSQKVIAGTNGCGGDPIDIPDQTISFNPKTSAGRAKPALFSVIPNAALLHLGEVMKLGAKKYGPFNWRSTPVPAEVYIDAAGRHLLSWFDGEDTDPESGMSHLGHVMACCSILIDAQENGMLDDNRPKAGRIGEMVANFQKTGKFNP